MTPQTCPDRDTLERLLLGKLPAKERESLGEHLLHCEDCAASAATLTAEDDLTTALQSRKSVQAGDDEILAQVIERGKQLGSNVETVQAEETVLVGDRQVTDAPTQPEAGVDQEVIDILLPPEEPDEIGRLGGYRILEVLGVGGMGVVFRAEDVKLKRQVALKAMKPAIAASKSARERFLQEAQAAAAIEHDHIVTIHQVGEDRGIPFIAMRYLRGESLRERLDRETRFDQREVARLGRQIALGLAAAHEQGLIHRDIKPDNIWLDSRQDRVKIVDFGLVRSMSQDAGLTQSGLVVGTPKYMAPEQAEGQTIDHRCDLFSLGSVLYHLVTGVAPFAGPNITATLLAVARATPTPIADLRPDLHPDLAALIMRLLSKAPAERPQTAKEVAQQLAEIESHLETEPPAPPTIEQLADTVIAQPAPADDDSQPPRRRLHTALGRLAAIILLGVVLFKFVTRDGTVYVELDAAYDIHRVEVDETTVSWERVDNPQILKFHVDPGTHTVRMFLEDGTEITTEATEQPIAIAAGGEQTIKAWLERDEVIEIAGAAPGATAGLSGSAERNSASNFALSFDGEDDFVTLPDVSLESFQNLTVEAWVVKHEVDRNQLEGLIELSGDRKILLDIAPNRTTVSSFVDVADANGMRLHGGVTDSDAIDPVKPTHLACTWNGRTMSLFRNGRRVGELTIRQVPDTTSLPVPSLIGAMVGYARDATKIVNHFQGTLDEVRISSIARYAEDFTPEPRFDPDEHTLALYHFDEGVGMTLSDASGNGHHGTIHGATWVKIGEDGFRPRPSDDPAILALLERSDEWEWSEPVNLGPDVNSRQHDGGPCLSADGLTLIFQSDRAGGHGERDLWISVRPSVEDAWSVPKNLGPRVNSAFADSNAFLSPDGLQLYFESDRPSGLGDSDLWLCTRPDVGQAWSPAVNLGVSVNSAGYDGGPTLSPDGLTLLFVSDTEPFRGLGDLWECTRETVDGPWLPRRRLSDVVNSPAFDGYAILADDGLMMIYNSNRAGGGFPGGLWGCTRASLGEEWSAPARILPSDSQSAWAPSLSSDNRTLVFDSRRPGGSGSNDLWMSRLVPTNVTTNPDSNFALAFDGQDDVISLPAKFDGRNPVTIEAVIQPEDLSDDKTKFATILSNSESSGLSLEIVQKHVVGVFSENDTQGYRFIQSDVPVSETEATHVALVYDLEQVRLYVNGKRQKETLTVKSGHKTSTEPFIIGGNPEPTRDPNKKEAINLYSGMIDELRISSIARYTEDFTPQERFEPDQHTLALYHFNDAAGTTLTDASGNGHDGTIHGATWVHADGAPIMTPPPRSRDSIALRFDGEKDFVEVKSLRDADDQPITLEAWVQPESFGRMHDVLHSSRHGFGGIGMGLWQDNLGFGVTEGRDDWRLLEGSDVLSLNERHHVAAVFDGQEMRVFVNGRLNGRRPLDKRMLSGAGFCIGAKDERQQCFHGTIDEIRISNVARYAQDFTPQPRFEPDEHTLALYHFDDAAGATLTDASGNAHHGTIHGATWIKLEGSEYVPLRSSALSAVPSNIGSREGTAEDRREVEWPADAPPLAVAPFDADEASQHQQAWADYLGVPVEREISLGEDANGNNVTLSMVLIPPGEFLMGSSEEVKTRLLEQGEAANDTWAMRRIAEEGSQRRVWSPQPFYLGQHEVTRAQWRTVSTESHTDLTDRAEYPVEQVSWNDIQRFLTTLNESGSQEGLRFDLPTEAQWEFACRSGTTTLWHCGDRETMLPAFAWFDVNSGAHSQPVGRLKPNAFGLYDMHGNVWEWCADAFQSEGPFDSSVGIPNDLDTAAARVYRGGSWGYNANSCRSALRIGYHPTYSGDIIGFRLAATIDLPGVKPATHSNGTLRFDGEDDYVETPVRFDVTQPLTVEGYFTVPKLPESNQVVLCDANLGGFGLGPREDGKWRMDVQAAGGRRSERDEVGYVRVESDEEINYGRRTHVAAVYDGRIVRLYVDGKVQTQRRAVEDLIPSTLPILIGANPNEDTGTMENFLGTIDEVRISNIARYTTDFTPAERHEPDEHTLALYHFDEGEGDVLTDASGKGHHGTIHGATWVKLDDDSSRKTE